MVGGGREGRKEGRERGKEERLQSGYKIIIIIINTYDFLKRESVFSMSL